MDKQSKTSLDLSGQGHKPADGTVPTRAIDRRSLIGGAAAVVGGAATASLAAPTRARAQQRRSGGAMDLSGAFKVVGCGEMMVSRGFARNADPDFEAVVTLMQGADLCYAHTEMNFGTDAELKWTPRGTAGGASYMIADPSILHDLADAGLDCTSLAHNHSFDWGPEGIFSTIRNCEAAGIAHSGTGKNLEAARAPGFFELDAGRMALVSTGSGNNQYEWAGLPKGRIPGRPGMNPLRVSTRYELDRASAQAMKEIGLKLGVLNEEKASKALFNIVPSGGAGITGQTAFSFLDGEKIDIHTTGNPADLTGNLRSIDEAVKMSDFVIISHHNSTSEGSRGTTPSDFVFDFARRSIDAGADIYFGHGWHTFLGIEIYKGKPIVYGMGNFFNQNVFLDRVPADSYAAYGFDMDDLTSLNPATGNLHPGANQEDWCWGALMEFNYMAGALREILLHPIDTGMDFSSGKGVLDRTVGTGPIKYIDGIPHLARGASGRNILSRLRDRCALRGTDMQVKDGVGVISLA